MEDAIRRNRLELLVLWLAGVLLIGWQHLDVLRTIEDKWRTDAAFSHGFLVVPICLWLAWRKRAELRGIALGPSWLGVAALGACTLAWIVARGSGVLVVEQLAVVAMVPSLVLAIFGWQATRTLIFPLAMLAFCVPFGRAIVPWLMQITADIATVGLQWSGVPVFRSHMHIMIPGGWFEVALACSGLNYFVTGLLLGVLFAHLEYQSAAKRAICVAAFVIIPVLLNGVRVYLTILVSHLTDMRFGPGSEHVVFGRVFFIVMMVVMFWVAHRWHDPPKARPAAPNATAPLRPPSLLAWAALPAAVLAILVGPYLYAASVDEARLQLGADETPVRMPVATADWQGPDEAPNRWRPRYQGAFAERQAIYRDAGGAPVDVFVAVYGLGNSLGAEMISYGNVIVAEQFKSLADEARRRISLPDGSTLTVKQLVVPDGAGSRLVWYLYLVGDRPALGAFGVKALEALAVITGGAHSERVLTLSTPQDDGADARLSSFVAEYATCVRAGFAGEACGG